MFYWNYEAPGCANPAAEPAINSTTGAILRANRSDTDFALFELTESPVTAGFNVYFNGWSRTTSPGTGGVGIHHPSGDIKKIATHSMVPSNGTIWGSDHWRVNWDATANGHSVTEGGSSGSPLFRSNGQIIGQLHGGSSVNCSDPSNDPGEYGKFNLSWNGSSSGRRLSSWLGTSFSTNGRYFCDNLDITGPSTFCPSASFSVNVPDDYPVTWSVSPANSLTFTQGNSTTTFTRNGNHTGLVTITANIVTNCGPVNISQNAYVQGTMGVNITNAQPGSTMTISATASGGSAPFTWYINGTLEKTTSSRDVLIRYRCRDAGLTDLQVRSTTSCGLATATDYFYDDCGRSQRMAVYPNPASSEIFITKKDDTKNNGQAVSATSEDGVSTEIFDYSGQVIHNENFKKSSYIPKINVSNLKKGNYFLRIVGKETDEVHQIVIE